MFQLPLIAHSASSNHWSENVKHLSTPSIFAGSEEFNPMLKILLPEGEGLTLSYSLKGNPY